MTKKDMHSVNFIVYDNDHNRDMQRAVFYGVVHGIFLLLTFPMFALAIISGDWLAAILRGLLIVFILWRYS